MQKSPAQATCNTMPAHASGSQKRKVCLHNQLELAEPPRLCTAKKRSDAFVVEVETKVYYCFWLQYSTALYKISND